MKEEFCIMPHSIYYKTKRFYGSERHEVFEGRTGNRDKSIEDGLVIFLTPEMHRTGKKSVHLNPKFWKEVVQIQKIAEKAWCDYYNKTPDDFRIRYGRNYL
ncbi:MAG: hypothetical protein IJ193_03590 [Bacilli bacterium]|nr:hypothetical protein [Bacilli bacterium]